MSVVALLGVADFVGNMRPVGRYTFTAAQLEAFGLAAVSGDNEEGGFAGHVGDKANLFSVRAPAGGGFDIAVVGEALCLVGREIMAIKIDLVAEAEGEADELSVAGEGG